ncbi:MAG: DNA/RNA non-specific endonuclease [Bacilli bacterium]|nr:DNA/RNA non-specific endonuclease [Bacilli bacterium]
MSKKQKKRLIFAILYFLIILITIYFENDINRLYNKVMGVTVKSYSIDEIPLYDGMDYVIINNNKPDFKDEDIVNSSFEKYSNLDMYGRCGVAYANLGLDTMPTSERERIGNVKPSGWQISKYDFIEGKYLYNRCHLIGYQLSGENANEKNLITCTRQMNSIGMLQFENKVASYIRKTGNHVLYRVSPIFKDKNLIVEGVQMEALSVEDKGKGIRFNVFVYNVQDKVVIDYKDGSSRLAQ